jgi:ribosomal-protein-alanine N-acetyltransferase
MRGWLSRLFGGAPPAVEPAGLRDAATLARLHGAAFHRGWDVEEFERMLLDPAVLAHRLRRGRQVIGFCLSRLAADEAEILSVAIASAQRGRGLSRDLLQQHLRQLAGRGIARVFLEVEETNQPARRLYDRAGFRTVGRRERYYRSPGGEDLHALVMRRDLS